MNDTSAGSENSFSQQLVNLIHAVEASGYAVLPSTDQELLESVVEAAARILNAKAASIALVDEAAGELEFKVSFDQTGGHSVIGMRFPISQGIAGGSSTITDLLGAPPQEAPSDLAEMAALLNDITSMGPAERRACIQILEVFSKYGRRKTQFL